MKASYSVWAIFAACIAFAAFASAASRAEFDQLVQQVQAKPADNALRERVIKMAQELKPAPAIPEEAREQFVAGSAIAKSAKDASGQKLAIKKFQSALKIAPWWGDAYYNLATAQDLAGQFDAAIGSLKLYILTNPSEKETREAQDRIYALKGKAELAKAEHADAATKPSKTSVAKKPEPPAPSPAEAQLALLRSLNGAKYFRRNEWLPGRARDDDTWAIVNEELFNSHTTINLQENLSATVTGQWHWQDGEFRNSVGSLGRICISADGQQITNCVTGEVLGRRTQ